jgi:hypothetical protein
MALPGVLRRRALGSAESTVRTAPDYGTTRPACQRAYEGIRSGPRGTVQGTAPNCGKPRTDRRKAGEGRRDSWNTPGPNYSTGSHQFVVKATAHMRVASWCGCPNHSPPPRASPLRGGRRCHRRRTSRFRRLRSSGGELRRGGVGRRRHLAASDVSPAFPLPAAAFGSFGP